MGATCGVARRKCRGFNLGWSREIAGFIVAVIACVIVLYALPATIARRVAVVTSREGDRFSPGVESVPCKQAQVEERMHQVSYLTQAPSSQCLSEP